MITGKQLHNLLMYSTHPYTQTHTVFIDKKSFEMDIINVSALAYSGNKKYDFMCYTDNKELIQIPQHSIGSQFIHSSHGQAFKQVSYARAENNLCVWHTL